MSKMLKTVTIAAGLMAPGVAMAGSQYNNYHHNCTKYADGSGSCSGNFISFRNHIDPNAFVAFVDSASRYFTASYPDVGSVTCYPNATVSALWPRAMTHTGWFAIRWDASGTCISLAMTHSSAHSNF